MAVTRTKNLRVMVARWLTAAWLLFLFSVSVANASAFAKEGPATPVPGDASSEKQALDPATAETLTVKDARRLIASSSEVLALPRLSNLSVEVAHELATNREDSGTCTYKVCVPVGKEMTRTYSVMVPYTEEKTREDGTKVTVTKCRPETRTRTFTVTICVPEERSHVCPLTLRLDRLTTPKGEVLGELAKHDGNLHLNGLKALSRDDAQQLAAHKGGSLALNGIGSMDVEVAEALASHAGDLSLDGIRSLTATTAKALAASKHGVSLNGVTELSDEVAAELALHKGSVSLTGLAHASQEAVQLLRARPVALPQKLLSEQNNEKE